MEETEAALHETPLNPHGFWLGDQFGSTEGFGNAALKLRSCCKSLFGEEAEARRESERKEEKTRKRREKAFIFVVVVVGSYKEKHLGFESFHFSLLVLLKKKKKNTGRVKRRNKEGKKGIYQDVKKSGHSWCSHAM